VKRQQEGSLFGKVVVITGASRGVGKQAALDFARRGAKVVLAARTVEANNELPGSLDETVKQIEVMGADVLAVPTDLACEDDLNGLVDAAARHFGGVDVLINNAAATTGKIWSKRFLELSREEWMYQFAVNVHAPFTLMQQVVSFMEKRGGGRIINLSTGSGEVFRLPEEPQKLQSVGAFSLEVPGYYASKRALDRLGNAVAPELDRCKRREKEARGHGSKELRSLGARHRRLRRRRSRIRTQTGGGRFQVGVSSAQARAPRERGG
jgi:NAD(P)-dependent dehydrogenase (short-subunit alcohol dehydrogenase family)